MRRLKLLIAVSLLLTFTLSEAMAQQGNYRLGEVLGLRYFTVTKGDLDTYEQTIKDVQYPFYDRNMPDADWVLMKGDRGQRRGEYAWFWNITTLERRNVVIDLDNTETLDSAGLTALLDAQDALRELGGDAKIATKNHGNCKILEITQLDQHLDVFDSVIDAVKSFC